MARYLLDSNTLIQSKNTIPMDIFPCFWEKLGGDILSGKIVIHESVWAELDAHKDELLPWIKSLDGVKKYKKSDEAFDVYLKLFDWARSQDYTEQAIKEFSQETRADAWLCAEAAVSDLTLVTCETPSNSLKKVKIPNVCRAFGISCCNWFDFLRLEEYRF